jgi:hypothetical protein
MYWGNAIEVANKGVRGGDLAVARREAVMPYLEGLKENLAYLSELEDNMPPEGNVAKPKPGDAAPSQRELTGASYAAWQHSRLKEKLVQHQNAYETQIVYLYSRLPFATSELEKLAGEALGDKAEVDRLIGLVKARVDKRLDDLGANPWKELPQDFESLGAREELPNISESQVNTSKTEHGSTVGEKGTPEVAQDEPRDGRNTSYTHTAIIITLVASVLIAVAVVFGLFMRTRLSKTHQT